MSLTAADVRRIVREELARELPGSTRICLDLDAIKTGLREHFAAETRRSLQALDLQSQHLELQLDDALLQRRESFQIRKALLEKRILRLEAEKALLQRREAVHGEPPCGCGDDTVGGPDPGAPSGGPGSGPDGGAS